MGLKPISPAFWGVPYPLDQWVHSISVSALATVMQGSVHLAVLYYFDCLGNWCHIYYYLLCALQYKSAHL